MAGGAVVVRRPEVGAAGADQVAGRGALVGGAVRPLRGRQPLAVPEFAVGLGDPLGGGEAFADLGAALRGVGQGADELGVIQVVVQGEGHGCSRCGRVPEVLRRG